MKKLFRLSVMMFVLAISATQLAGCETMTRLSEELSSEESSSVQLYTDMWLEVAQTCSAEGYRTAVKGEDCRAFQHARLVVVRSSDGYLLLRYDQRSDIVAQDLYSWKNFCPPGVLTIMSEEEFEMYQRFYEKEFRKRQATEEFFPEQ